MAPQPVMGEAILSLEAGAVFLVDAETLAIVEANRGFSRLFGYSGAVVTSLSLQTLWAGQPEALTELVGVVARDGYHVLSAGSYRHADGRELRLRGFVGTAQAKGRTFYCFVAREPAAAEHAAELRRKILTEGAFEALGITEKGVVVDGNDRFAELLGAPLDQIIGRPVLDFVPSEYHKLMIDRLQQNAVEPLDHELTLVDGTRIPVEAQAKTLEIEGRTIRVTALRDISQRKRMEEQVRRALRMEAIGRLAGGVAHDFNNLLTVIMSVVKVMGEAQRSEADVSDLHQIEIAAERAAQLTSHLLAFARKQITEPKVIDINALVHGIHSLLRRLIGEHITLKTVCQSELGAVRVDPTQVEQIVMNLAVNARDAMSAGGTLTIETKNVELGSDYAFTHPEVTPGEYVMIGVSDTGSGMDPETLARIFEPFFTTKEQGRGTGLGLATCYGIVKQSGGSIWAYSEVGRGSTFKVYLPRVRAALSKPEPKRAVVSPSGHETLLLVEDDELVRRIAARILTSHGYKLILAVDGEEAIRRFSEVDGKIDALITDVVLPKVSAKELVAELKRRKPELRVLYTSGYTENTVVHQGVVDADVNFLAKPYLPSDLTRAVRAVLDKK
ncbi:MAG TPA: ATP-binding protein [Polyangiaceae bacterium]|nr:ATP-binding protein [Polyangiaceae bacterium]